MKKKHTKKSESALDLGNGWIKAKRNYDQAQALMSKSRNASCLLYLIALRAWRGPGINQHGCGVGEGFVGDYEKWGFTQKEYRVAKTNLEQFGFASFRATNRGTIARLLTADIFDINIEMDVTERPIQGRARGEQRASRGRAEGEQGATNKKSRSEEAKKFPNQKINSNNNAANAGVVGAVPPSEDSGEEGEAAAAEGEAETGAEAYSPIPETTPEITEGATPEGPEDTALTDLIDNADTPDQKAATLAAELPLFVRRVAKLSQRPTFTADTLQGALEWFQRNPEHEWYDVLAICILGAKNAREVPAPEEGFDPYFWSRKYALKPNKLFETNADDDLILTALIREGKWELGPEHGIEWAEKLHLAELARVERKHS